MLNKVSYIYILHVLGELLIVMVSFQVIIEGGDRWAFSYVWQYGVPQSRGQPYRKFYHHKSFGGTRISHVICL